MSGLLSGLQPSIFSPEPVADAPLPPGDWCAAVPLWGNPLLPHFPQPSASWVAETPINSISSLLLAYRAASCPPSLWLSLRAQHFGGSTLVSRVLQPFAQQAMAALLQRLPAPWVRAVRPTPNPSPLHETTSLLLERLGWTHGTGQLPASDYNVRGGTQLLLQLTEQPRRRAEYFSSFCRAALGAGASPIAIQEAVAGLPCLLQRLWRLQWDNKRKEVLWRLLYDGLPTAARLHMVSLCACGHVSPDRVHHFWDCPVASAVVNVAAAQLPGAPALSRAQVWLGVEPAGCIAEVWAVACLCMLVAMERGRRAMWKRIDGGQSPTQSLVSALQNFAIAQFWESLTDFCAVGAAPDRWKRPLAGAHPFIHFDANTSQFSVRRLGSTQPLA